MRQSAQTSIRTGAPSSIDDISLAAANMSEISVAGPPSTNLSINHVRFLFLSHATAFRFSSRTTWTASRAAALRSSRFSAAIDGNNHISEQGSGGDPLGRFADVEILLIVLGVEVGSGSGRHTFDVL